MSVIGIRSFCVALSKPLASSRNFSTASLYVHWPYCQRRCMYCNFNKYVSESVDHDRMMSCLVEETKTLISQAGVHEITSVFFGGGTPSLAKPKTLAAVIDAVNDVAYLPPTAEVSMEVNPTALRDDKLHEFKTSGINRVSVGVQTLNASGLQILSRDHTAEDSLRCLESAKDLFPGRVSLDLMFGWPGQTLTMWTEELEQISSVCDNHLSLYQLTVEEGTPLLKQVKTGKLRVADASLMEDMYLTAVKTLKDNNFERYEVSNFAKEGFFCHHNMSYWDGGQYIGIGPGAHGRFQLAGHNKREARIQALTPASWMKEVEKNGHGTRVARPLSPLERLEELLVVGLRTKWGVTHQTWQSICPTFDPTFDLRDLKKSEAVKQHLDKGLLILDKGGLRASEEGINIIDTLVVSLLVALKERFNILNGVT